jgi:uncharacterized protein YjiS (DUF1127 family)
MQCTINLNGVIGAEGSPERIAQGIVMSFANLLVAAGRAVAERRRRHADYAELMALDDRTLADIGIHRSEIAGIIYGEDGERRAAAPAARAIRTRRVLHGPA